MVLYLMLFLCSLVGLMRWWTVYVQLTLHVWTVESLRKVGNGKEGFPSVARALNPPFRSSATRPRRIDQSVTPFLPRSWLARGGGTKSRGAAIVALSPTSGLSHAWLFTYALLHSTCACDRLAVVVAPSVGVPVRWFTALPHTPSQHHGSQRFTTVHNGSPHRHNPGRPTYPARPFLHNASQPSCPVRPSLPGVARTVLLVSSSAILLTQACSSLSFSTPVPYSSNSSTIFRTPRVGFLFLPRSNQGSDLPPTHPAKPPMPPLSHPFPFRPTIDVLGKGRS